MKKLLTWLLLLSASLFFAHPVNADADTTANSEVFASIYRQGVSKGKYVDVYRIKKHPHYADAASTYAYRHLYKNPKDRPKYGFQSGLYSMKDSYCSKYVYYAYYKVLPKGALKTYNNRHIVPPFTFVGNFQGDFKASYLHQITSWK